MGAKAPLLRLRRTILVEIVEPRLPERNDLRMPCQVDQLLRRDAVLLVRVMRMRADRAVDARKARRDVEQPVEPAHAGRDRDDADNAGGLGAPNDGVEVAGEVREVEVTVAVDQHQASSFGST
jgi:hypothetical protein